MKKSLLICACLGMLVISSCSNFLVDGISIVGTWKYNHTEDSGSTILEFLYDETCTYTTTYGSMSMVMTGEYSIDEDLITMKFRQEDGSLSYMRLGVNSIDYNSMEVYPYSGGITVSSISLTTFKRQ